MSADAEHELVNYAKQKFRHRFDVFTVVYRCCSLCIAILMSSIRHEHASLLSNDTSSSSSSRALIIVNGDIGHTLLSQLWNNAGIVVLADGAANRVFDVLHSEQQTQQYSGDGNGFRRPDYICGDMDSIRNEVLAFFTAKGTRLIRAISQSHHDLCKCLCALLREHDLEAEDDQSMLLLSVLELKEIRLPMLDVIVYGAFGGRFDHEMAGIGTLYTFEGRFRELVLLSDNNFACLLSAGKHEIVCKETLQGPTCGLLPVGNPVRHCTTQGLRWNLDAHELRFGALISTSNLLNGSLIAVDTSDPLIWTTAIQIPSDDT